MTSRNPTLKTINKILNAFNEFEALSQSFFEQKLGINHFTLKEAIAFLKENKRIRPIKSSSKGILYVKSN